MSKALLASLLILVLGAGAALAQSKVGTTVAQFMSIEPSARNAAMGNSGTALSDGIESVYFNPGAIGALNERYVQFTHSLWFVDVAYDYVALGLPLRGWGVLFSSITALNSGDIAVRTVEQPHGTGEQYTVSNVAIALGYGRQVTTHFTAGIQLNYISESIWNTSANTLTFNAGTVYTIVSNGLQIGFSLSNIGTSAKYQGRDLAMQYDADPDSYGDNSSLPAEKFTDSFPVPVLFRLGLALPRKTGKNNQILFSLDALHPNDNTESLNLGAEWSWSESLFLRGGYQTLFQQDSELGLTLGAGLRSKFSGNFLNIDYGWAGHKHLGATHRFTLILAY